MCEVIWKEVPGMIGYSASSQGDIKQNGKMLKLTTGSGGYVSVYIRNERKTIGAHRIICKTFHINEENKPCVNHINAIRNDNRAINLEWCTHKENIIHGVKMGNVKPPGCKKIINTQTGEVYKSLSEACRKLNLFVSHLSVSLNKNIGQKQKKKYKHLKFHYDN
jgi:hypothetical protein